MNINYRKLILNHKAENIIQQIGTEFIHSIIKTHYCTFSYHGVPETGVLETGLERSAFLFASAASSSF